MDRHTLEKLEFAKVCEIVARHARTALGRQLAHRIRPSSKVHQVTYWLDQVRQMQAWIERRGLPPFAGVGDIRALITKAVPPSVLEPPELADVRACLRATGAIVDWLAHLPDDFAALKNVAARVGDYRSLAERIDRVIDERAQIRDDASSRLAKIRRQIADAERSIKKVYERLLKSPDVLKVLQYPSVTFHGDRLVLPVRAECRSQIEGIVHRSSDSGATLFIEPAEVVKLNNVIVSLRQEENEEIGRLLWQLSHLIQLNAEGILQTLQALAVLDLIAAKAILAKTEGWVVPAVVDSGPMRLRQVRHPLLIELHRQQAKDGADPKPVVPIDVRLGDDFDVLIVTGPNTGGKTVALKTVGLAAVMAQAGLPIPAEDGSQLPVYRDVLIDVGDEQSLQQSLSTFSAHLKRILSILRRANEKTLVLLDELGSGTDPDEGAAIGQAILDELIRRKAPTIITTHLGVLKGYAYRHERADNAAVEFDVATLQPTYRLRIGEPGNSNAIEIARRLGMPQPLLKAAREHLAGKYRALSRAIEGTLESRRRAEAARQEAEQAALAAKQAEAEYRRQAEQLKAEQEAFRKWMERITSLRPGDRVRLRRFDREATVVRMLLHKQAVVVDSRGIEIEVPLTDIIVDGIWPGGGTQAGS